MNDTKESQLKRLFYFIYSWLVIIPVLIVVTVVVCSSIILVSAFGYPDLAGRLFAIPWARINLATMLSGITVTGLEKAKKGQPYIVVANHQSLLDIYAVYGYLGLDIKWVMKKELRKVPFLGKACEMMGHIIVDRSDTKAALKSINEAQTRILKGNSVIFFPEGTRSLDGKLLPFKKGAFRLAKDLELPILPVAIQGARHILPSQTMRFTPGHIYMEVLDPISKEEVKQSDVNSLSARTRSVLEAALEQRAGDTGSQYSVYQ
ncbi:MAG: 1-acyl-sn-glycerol-3-phosphate acyltransferase [Gammaproteobacteria bacterium]|nr:1-acyl-sn-glycerol-3-phosphate acyltransferase [Gammaproteobacteria bacterium]